MGPAVAGLGDTCHRRSMQLSPLPIDPALSTIEETLREGTRALIRAEPGAGKTTRVPPLLVGWIGPKGDVGAVVPAEQLVVVLEPRRIAARLAARRVAAERGTEVGGEVGYQVRFERRRSHATRILFVTEGVLLRWLLDDPELPWIGAVVLDEFHERSLEADLCLALLREVQRTIRPELRLVVMSATLETVALADYLDPVPLIDVPGREHPIEIDFMEAVPAPPLEESVLAAAQHLWAEGFDESVLVFVPGAAEIRRCLRALDPWARRAQVDLHPLHGDLSAEDQERAIRPSTRPRIIVSTNVAEASVTVAGVHAVIDSGRVRVARFDPGSGVDRLLTERITRASAIQRAGRAGRLGPGRCVRLYSEREFETLASAIEPEIERIDLSGAALAVKAWGDRDLASFEWLTPPRPEALERAQSLLCWLGALESGSGRITPLGRRLLRYPVPPRLARVLDAACELGVGRAGALAVAIAETGDLRRESRVFAAPRTRVQSAESDVLVLSDLYQEAAAGGFSREALEHLGLDARSTQRASRIHQQLLGLLPGSSRNAPPNLAEVTANRQDPRAIESAERAILRAILAGHPDRVARRHGPGAATGVLVGGTGIELERTSAVRAQEFFVALAAIELPVRRGQREGRSVRVRTASAIEPEWLEEIFPGSVTTRDELIFEPRGQRVVARRVTAYRDLSLREHETGEADPSAIASVLRDAVLNDPERALNYSTETHEWIHRLHALQRFCPEISLPDFSRDLLPRALTSLCFGVRSFAELRRRPLLPALQRELGPAETRLLDRLAPARVQLPSGREAKIDFSGETPVLAARLQEFFGLARTPRLGDDRLPLLLHLLAPSHRPLQITQDLASFWTSVYPKVRGELRRRYPKHSWPEDPLAARPESRPGGGRRRG